MLSIWEFAVLACLGELDSYGPVYCVKFIILVIGNFPRGSLHMSVKPRLTCRSTFRLPLLTLCYLHPVVFLGSIRARAWGTHSLPIPSMRDPFVSKRLLTSWTRRPFGALRVAIIATNFSNPYTARCYFTGDRARNHHFPPPLWKRGQAMFFIFYYIISFY